MLNLFFTFLILPNQLLQILNPIEILIILLFHFLIHLDVLFHFHLLLIGKVAHSVQVGKVPGLHKIGGENEDLGFVELVHQPRLPLDQLHALILALMVSEEVLFHFEDEVVELFFEQSDFLFVVLADLKDIEEHFFVFFIMETRKLIGSFWLH